TRILSRGLECTTPIVEAMRRDVPNITPEANEVECASLMKDNATRHLLVFDRNEVVGLISMRDVMQMMLADKQFLIEQMQSYIQGYSDPGVRGNGAYPVRAFDAQGRVAVQRFRRCGSGAALARGWHAYTFNRPCGLDPRRRGDVHCTGRSPDPGG